MICTNNHTNNCVEGGTWAEYLHVYACSWIFNDVMCGCHISEALLWMHVAVLHQRWASGRHYDPRLVRNSSICGCFTADSVRLIGRQVYHSPCRFTLHTEIEHVFFILKGLLQKKWKFNLYICWLPSMLCTKWVNLIWLLTWNIKVCETCLGGFL